MKMAKASQNDLDCATLVIGMIDDIERGDYPRNAFGQHEESEPDFFDANDPEHCQAFVTQLLMVVGKREHGGSLMRVVFGMITALGNEMFDPDKDHLDWHPDLVPAVLERQRRRAIEKVKPGNALIIDWKKRDQLRFRHDFSGYVARLYSGDPENGWVLAYKEGGGDITFPIKPPKPGMEPVRVNLGEGWAWCWVQFGKEASNG